MLESYLLLFFLSAQFSSTKSITLPTSGPTGSAFPAVSGDKWGCYPSACLPGPVSPKLLGGIVWWPLFSCIIILYLCRRSYPKLYNMLQYLWSFICPSLLWLSLPLLLYPFLCSPSQHSSIPVLFSSLPFLVWLFYLRPPTALLSHRTLPELISVMLSPLCIPQKNTQ